MSSDANGIGLHAKVPAPRAQYLQRKSPTAFLEMRLAACGKARLPTGLGVMLEDHALVNANSGSAYGGIEHFGDTAFTATELFSCCNCEL